MDFANAAAPPTTLATALGIVSHLRHTCRAALTTNGSVGGWKLLRLVGRDFRGSIMDVVQNYSFELNAFGKDQAWLMAQMILLKATSLSLLRVVITSDSDGELAPTSQQAGLLSCTVSTISTHADSNLDFGSCSLQCRLQKNSDLNSEKSLWEDASIFAPTLQDLKPFEIIFLPCQAFPCMPATAHLTNASLQPTTL